MIALIFCLCAISMGVRDVYWPRAVRGDAGLAAVKASRGGIFLINGAVVCLAFAISVFTLLNIRGTERLWTSEPPATLAGIAACTAIAWVTALAALFTRLGPARALVVDWGSLPLFQVIIAGLYGSYPSLQSMGIALLALAGIGLYVWSPPAKPLEATGGDTLASAVRSARNGFALSVLSAFFGAWTLQLTAGLDSSSIGVRNVSLAILPLRLGVTALLFCALSWRQRSSLAVFRPLGVKSWGKLLLFAVAYVVPLSVCYALLTPETLPDLARALTLIAVSALICDWLISSPPPRVARTEWVAFFLFGMGNLISLGPKPPHPLQSQPMVSQGARTATQVQE